MRRRSIGTIVAGAIALAGAMPATAHHEDPNCTLTVHPPIVGLVKIYVGCEHGPDEDHGGGNGGGNGNGP